MLRDLWKSPPNIKAGTATAKAVLFVRQHKVLLLQKASGQWDLPGGKLETGEGWIEGLAREVYEESGFKIDDDDWIEGRINTRKGEKQNLRGVFFCRLDCKPKKSLIAISNEHVKGDFFSLKEIDNLSLPEEYTLAIGWAAQKIGV